MGQKQRASLGGAYEVRGRFYAHVTVAPQQRRAEVLPWCTSLDDAKERGRAIQALVNRLRAAGETDWIEKLVESAAKGDAEKLAAVLEVPAEPTAGADPRATDPKPA